MAVEQVQIQLTAQDDASSVIQAMAESLKASTISFADLDKQATLTTAGIQAYWAATNQTAASQAMFDKIKQDTAAYNEQAAAVEKLVSDLNTYFKENTATMIGGSGVSTQTPAKIDADNSSVASNSQEVSSLNEVNTAVANTDKTWGEYIHSIQVVSDYQRDFNASLAELNPALDQEAVAEETSTEATNNNSTAHSNLAGNLIKSTLAAFGIVNVLMQTVQFIKSCTTEAIQYQSSLMGLAGIANNVGWSHTELNDTLKKLTSDGLTSAAEAADYLRISMEGSRVNEQQLIDEHHALEEMTVGVTNATGDFGDTVNKMAKALTAARGQGDVQIEGMGRYSDVIKAGEQATGLSMNATDSNGKALIEYNAIMIAAQKSLGNLTEYQKSNIGQITEAKAGFENLKLTIGNSFVPVLVDLAKAFNQNTSLGTDMTQTLRGVGVAAEAVVGFVEWLVEGIVTLVNVASAAGQGHWADAQAAWQEGGAKMTAVEQNTAKTITDIWSGASDQMAQDVIKSYAGVNNAALTTTNALQTLKDDMAKEETAYADTMAKNKTSFDDSLNTMIKAHQDKTKSLQKDLDDENASYTAANAKRLEDFNTTMAAIELSNSRSLRDNAENVDAENESYADKKSKLQDEIQKEEQKGSYIMGVWNSTADADKLASYRTELAQEEDAHQDSLTKLAQDLSDEQQDYQISVDNKKTTYDEDTASAKAAHDQKVADTQAELDAEKAILNAHVAEVAAVQDKAVVDDITRLENSYAEQKAAADADHKQKLVDFAKRGAELGTTEGIAEGTAYEEAVNEIKNGGTANSSKINKTVSSAITSYSQMASYPNSSPIQYASGGIIPGNIGEPVPIIAHGGERITPTNGVDVNSGGGSGLNITFTGAVSMNSDQDIQTLADKIIRQIGRRDELSRLGVGY